MTLTESFRNKKIFLLGLSTIAVILIATIFISIINLQKNFEDKIFELSTNDITSIAQNSAKEIYNFIAEINDQTIVDAVKADINLQASIENTLSLLLTKNIKYAYIIYKDEKNVFRFLSDASSDEEKAMVGQKFDVESPEWFEVFENKKPLFIKHDFIKELSVTYLVPILRNDKVAMLLVVDFSVAKTEDISNIINNIKYSILAILVVILLAIIILIYQTLRFYVLRKSNYIDQLTNIYNKNYLQDYAAEINLRNYILCSIDIDDFKKINDIHGYSIGDNVLKAVALLLWREVRKNKDILVRYGGEEFCLFIKKENSSQEELIEYIEKILVKVKNYNFEISDFDYINLSICIGINLTPHEQIDFPSALKIANIALNNAKNKGRSKIEIYGSNDNDLQLLTIDEIKEALNEDRILCYYQRVVATKTFEISHYEALIRLQAKDGSIITPNRFLSVVKDTVVAKNITKTVLKICFNKLRTTPTMKIAINLNPQDLSSHTIIEILRDYAKVPTIAKRLGLEIIETEEIMNYEQIKHNILMLKALGYKIYIDDFGSGYSNFIYLSQIHANSIKIDGSIIKSINTDKLSYLVAKNIINFAKEAEIETIAEFVCDEETFNTVLQLGVDKCQGYYFCAPESI